ncbi:MAG: hypothetical protein BWY63_02722 [Chloroflexi bacterium ADurb.Bin360]|nr:MAG: hypothetical protein BWY63_02722 [Chloroflexi bacterium ADurb.Bin360]
MTGEPQVALQEPRQQRQHRDGARNPKFVDQGGIDEIAVNHGNEVGAPQAQSLPEQPTRRYREKRLQNLESAVGLFGRPGVEPNAGAESDPVGEHGSEHCDGHEHEYPHQHVRDAPPGKIEHCQRGKIKEQRGAQVLLPRQEHQCQADHQEHRTEHGGPQS